MIQRDFAAGQIQRVFKLAVIGVCAGGLLLAGCGKKGSGVGTVPEIIDTGEPGGDGSSLPGAGENPGEIIVTDEAERIVDIFFDYDRYEIRADARRVLRENARFLVEHSQQRILLEGHSDERGTNEYNLALGQRRADAVLQYLVDLGVDPLRLSSISYGEEKPFAYGSNESSWAENRRVHFALR